MSGAGHAHCQFSSCGTPTCSHSVSFSDRARELSSYSVCVILQVRDETVFVLVAGCLPMSINESQCDSTERRAVLGIFDFAPCEALAALTTISCAGH